jgi:uncharacterized protein (TIGR02217 family)
MTVGFIEGPRFPDDVAAWATGGRGFKTNIVETYGGDEYRTAAWTQQRGEWEVVNAWRSCNSSSVASARITSVRNFFRACMGQLGAFRFKDFTDFQDEGGGIFVLLTATTFQMYKAYIVGTNEFDQIIQKPVSATVVVTGGVSPVVDYTTGIVTVASGTPTSWTGQFDIPCRFNSDMPDIGLDESSGALYNWQSLKVVEVRNP